MNVGIMQPYFFPYVGYFHLMASVDLFVVYDNIQYTKKGWINRNRFLQNGSDTVFSIPIKKDSDYLNIDQRQVSPDFNKQKLLNQIRAAYAKAPHFATTYSLFEEAIGCTESNLFDYIRNSIGIICRELSITTKIIHSSKIPIDHSLQGEKKVLAICAAVGATNYVNAIGGITLYSSEAFANARVQLHFIKSNPFEYPQLGSSFVPWLSILDVMMFNQREEIQHYLTNGYSLLSNEKDGSN